MKTNANNQIPCTATTLTQLQPDMLSAIAPPSAYGFGRQYFSERRVRILQADDHDISSEVAGTTGLFKQTIRLAGGNLSAKCSCPSSEAPFCRHCVAVLLEYNRLHPGSEAPSWKTSPVPEVVITKPEKTGRADGMGTMRSPEGDNVSSAGLGVRLHEVTTFVAWMPAALSALNEGHPLPEAPMFGPGDALDWVYALRHLEERAREREETMGTLQGELTAKDQRHQSLTENLETMAQRLKEANAAYEELNAKCQHAEAAVSKLSGVEKERNRLVDNLKDMMGEMLQKASDMDRLLADFKHASDGKVLPGNATLKNNGPQTR